ncbi:nucleic acid-binding protein [Suillus brevipes Sb2]|nr:nucleic acid-binding protein [Suillus brevipes Sb2]
MLSSARHAFSRVPCRAFSTTSTRAYDVSKLILLGRLGKDPEIRTTKGDKEYASYTVATTNFPPPPPNPDGSRQEAGTTWHHIVCFNPSQTNYLRTLQKGAQVYVEANFELREADPSADSSSAQAQKQIFLRHESIRVIKHAPSHNETHE